MTDRDPSSNSAALEAISREIGETYARGHGHPPASAKSVWHEDVVVCVLEGVFTPAEREAVESGRFEWMRAERLARHVPLAPSFSSLIETVTLRPVRAYMNEVGPEDVAFEVFILGAD